MVHAAVVATVLEEGDIAAAAGFQPTNTDISTSELPVRVTWFQLILFSTDLKDVGYKEEGEKQLRIVH